MKKFIKGTLNFQNNNQNEMPYYFMNNFNMHRQINQPPPHNKVVNESTKETDSLSVKSEQEKQKSIKRTKIPVLLEFLTEVDAPLDLIDKKLYLEICKKAIVRNEINY